MSRIAKRPVELIDGAKASINGSEISVEGKNGKLSLTLHDAVQVKEEDGQLHVSPKVEDKPSWAMAGTMRSLVNNMVIGVTEGYKKELKLIGVGYRAAIQGNKLNLTLGYSHPIDFVKSKRPVRPIWWYPVPINNWLVKCLQKSVLSVHPSRIKVKVYVMLMSIFH